MQDLGHWLPAKEAGPRVGLGVTTFYKRAAVGLMTKPIKVGKLSFWPIDEVEVIAAAVAAGLPDDELRAMVAKLHARRRERFDTLRLSILEPATLPNTGKATVAPTPAADGTREAAHAV